MKLHIPVWAKTACLNENPIRVQKCHAFINRTWQDTEILWLTFQAKPHFVSRPTGLKTVEYSPLVFALPIETEYHICENTIGIVGRQCNIQNVSLHNIDYVREPLLI